MVTKSKLVHEPQDIQEPKLSKHCHQNNQGLMAVVLHAAFAALHTEMLPVGFSPNAFAHIPSPFAISTSGESNLSSQHPLLCHFAGRHPLVSGRCRWPPGVAGLAAQGVAEVWYLTKAIAASSLQNSSSTITPSSNVMWSMMGPSGSKPSRRFLTSRSLGVKSGMRWILTMRSPTTLTITEKRDLQPEARLT